MSQGLMRYEYSAGSAAVVCCEGKAFLKYGEDFSTHSRASAGTPRIHERFRSVHVDSPCIFPKYVLAWLTLKAAPLTLRRPCTAAWAQHSSCSSLSAEVLAAGHLRDRCSIALHATADLYLHAGGSPDISDLVMPSLWCNRAASRHADGLAGQQVAVDLPLMHMQLRFSNWLQLSPMHLYYVSARRVV